MAHIGSQRKLVPDTVLTGGEGGSASLVDAFLAMAIDKADKGPVFLAKP